MFRAINAKEKLLGLKKLKIGGMRFIIKRINPLIDFPSDRMPQIFTDFLSRREVRVKDIKPQDLKKNQEDMYDIIRAGLHEPQLVPIERGEKRGHEQGLTAEDLFRDPGMAVKLYLEILDHSLNRFKGLRKLFFSIGKRFYLLMLYADGTISDLQITSSEKIA